MNDLLRQGVSITDDAFNDLITKQFPIESVSDRLANNTKGSGQASPKSHRHHSKDGKRRREVSEEAPACEALAPWGSFLRISAKRNADPDEEEGSPEDIG